MRLNGLTPNEGHSPPRGYSEVIRATNTTESTNLGKSQTRGYASVLRSPLAMFMAALSARYCSDGYVTQRNRISVSGGFRKVLLDFSPWPAAERCMRKVE
jgi:hypothetical protein